MEKELKKINKNETYCCSLKYVKIFFDSTEAKVFFCSGEKFHANIYHIEKNMKNIKGEIICSMIMNTRSNYPQINFYAIEQDSYSSELLKKFHNEYLPKLYEFYQEL